MIILERFDEEGSHYEAFGWDSKENIMRDLILQGYNQFNCKLYEVDSMTNITFELPT